MFSNVVLSPVLFLLTVMGEGGWSGGGSPPSVALSLKHSHKNPVFIHDDDDDVIPPAGHGITTLLLTTRSIRVSPGSAKNGASGGGGGLGGEGWGRHKEVNTHPEPWGRSPENTTFFS